MEVILQIIFEFLLQVIAEILFEVLLRVGVTPFAAVFHVFARHPWTRKALSAVVTLILYFGLGFLAGFLSLLIFPHSFVRSSKLHGISLIITPLLAGLAMVGIGRLRQSRGQAVMRLDTFGYAFVFAFGMALMRFLATT